MKLGISAKHGAQHTITTIGFTLFGTGAALRTLNLSGVMKLRSIQGDENALVKTKKIGFAVDF